MPALSAAKKLTRHWTTLALGAAIALAGAASLPASALASSAQVAIIQDGSDLANAPAAMQEFRQLGANTVRVIVPWAQIAPSPSKTKKPNFTATDPNAYPKAGWAPYDAIVKAAQQYGLTMYFDVTGGAPRWAEASSPLGHPGESLAFLAWEPNAAAYGQFVQAIGTRYDGHFTPKGQSAPLPAVHFWSLFNEPNFGYDLGPQASNDSTVATAPMMYRGLLTAGWNALHATGHGHDTILWGEFAAQGFEPSPNPKSTGGLPGWYGQTRPMLFLRELYCVDTSFHQLRGSAARSAGCPTNAAGSRKFRSQNPALFNATGVADHPYPQGQSPISTAGNKVDFALFPDLGAFQRTLDRATGAYGAPKKFPIYNTEYGYITSPPKGKPYVSPTTAAYYMNWAEYLSWKQSYIKSYMQYLLQDPPAGLGTYSGFASGLEFFNGRRKPGYDAFRLPVYMPRTSFSHTATVEVWGAARPAPFMIKDGTGPQTVSVQLNGQTIKTVPVTAAGGYFDIRMTFPKSGTVRLAWTYPKTDSFLPVSDLGQTVYSRSFAIKVH
jgi:hypothetical protein